MRCAVFYFYPMEYVIRNQKTDIRRQKTEDRRQKTGNRYQRTDARRQKTGNRNQKTEDRKQKSEIRNQKSEIRNQISKLWAGICLKVSDPRLPAVFLFPQTEAFRNMLGNDPLCVFCPCIER